MKTFFVACCVFGVSLLPSTASAIIIDSFGSAIALAPPGITAVNTTVTSASGALSGVFGGSREASLQDIGGIPFVQESNLKVAAGQLIDSVGGSSDSKVTLNYDGNANGANDGQFGSLNLNLMGFTVLQLKFNFISAAGLTTTVSLTDNTGKIATATANLLGTNVPVTYNINFSSGIPAGFNQASVQQVNLVLDPPAGTTFVMGSNGIQIVPEPSSVALMATGLLGIFGYARRRRIAAKTVEA